MTEERESKEARLAIARRVLEETPRSSPDATELRLSLRSYIKEIAPKVDNVLAHSQSQHGDYLEKDVLSMDFDKRSDELERQLHDFDYTEEGVIGEVISVMSETDVSPDKAREIAFFITEKLGFQPSLTASPKTA